MEERLQKIISRAGLASRRTAERWIADGRVTVNGVVADEPGSKADPDRDEVRVDGKLVQVVAEPAYYLLHKPEGYVTTTRDPEGRPTVMHLAKRIKSRVYPVGRLDWATSGLLLLTSDGDLTRMLTHPSSQVPKTYQVKLKGRIEEGAIQELRKGPDIGGPPLRPAQVRFVKHSRGGGAHSWIEMTITEGRTRQIRRMCEAVGHPVLKLKRTALGPLSLGDLPPGKHRPLTDREVSALKKLMARRKEKAKPGKAKKTAPAKAHKK